MVDLRLEFPPVRDQRERGTCVAFAATAAHEALRSEGLHLSEEFVYWASKQRDGHPLEEGTTLVAAADALEDTGQPPETSWEYDSDRDQFDPSYQPPRHAVREAATRRIQGSNSIRPDVSELERALAATQVPLLERVMEM